MANENVVRVVAQPEGRSSIVHQLIDERKFTMLRTEASRILETLPKPILDESEGRVLREAQAIGALPANLPLTQVKVMYGGRDRLETFAGSNHEGDAWVPFQSPNITVAKFQPPDAAKIAASMAARKGWWQP